MIYNLESQTDIKRLQIYLDRLILKKKTVELKEITERSLSQNNYLHLIIGWFGMEFGYVMEEAKMIYKLISKETFFYEKDDFEFVRSSADLTSEEMTDSIRKFRDYSATIGLYLPEPSDINYLKTIQIELKNQKYR